jgi:hypothetical protein
MTDDNVTPFKPKKKPIAVTDIVSYLRAYAEAIEEVPEADRPTNLLILEHYSMEQDTASNLWMAGPEMSTPLVVGLLTMAATSVSIEE